MSGTLPLGVHTHGPTGSPPRPNACRLGKAWLCGSYLGGILDLLQSAHSYKQYSLSLDCPTVRTMQTLTQGHYCMYIRYNTIQYNYLVHCHRRTNIWWDPVYVDAPKSNYTNKPTFHICGVGGGAHTVQVRVQVSWKFRC